MAFMQKRTGQYAFVGEFRGERIERKNQTVRHRGRFHVRAGR